ncbi:MAG: LPD25 domain-containing protein [Lachnospiraceae bacterium]
MELSIGFSEHPCFYDRQFQDRFTDLSFALGNKLLGILDEKQHREREDESKQVGWYHKTDFDISAVIDGEDFHYEGRFDIGDGEGDLIAHIKNFYDYSLRRIVRLSQSGKSRARTTTEKRWRACVSGVICLSPIWRSIPS